MVSVTAPVIDPAAYARWRATALGSTVERVETAAVLGLAGRLAGRSVLDVATGDGTYALAAAGLGARVTALDLRQEMLEAARFRAAARGVRLGLVQGDARALPFSSGSFEVVIAVTVLCFVREARAAVREMARVLRPGGRLVLGELSAFSPWAAGRRVRGWLGASTWRGARFWTRRDLAGLVGGAGLRVARTTSAVYFPRCAAVACALAPLDPLFAHLHLPGAAFLALAADKPESP